MWGPSCAAKKLWWPLSKFGGHYTLGYHICPAISFNIFL
jgi:hypothetical protein